MAHGIGARVLSLFWSPSNTRVTLKSALTPDEIASSLRNSLEHKGNPRIRGRVVNRGVVLWLTRSHARSAFSPRFYGLIQEAEGGARIVGHFQLNPVSRLFLLVWFGLTSLVALLLLGLALSQNDPSRTATDALPFLLPPLLPLFGLLFVRSQQAKGRQDETQIVEWLKSNFDAIA